MKKVTSAVISFLTALLVLLISNITLKAQTFTSSGTWTCPPGVTSIQVECWGGGGAGAGSGSSGNLYTGGGGAGGNYSKATISVVPGTNYSYVVGSGGTSGPASGNTNGGNGGTTSFSTLLYASGGTGGLGGQTSQKVGVGGVNGGVYGFTITSTGSGYSAAPTVSIGTAWTSSTTYTLNQQVINAGKLYTVTTAGNSGTVAPTHTSGSVAATGGSAVMTYAGTAATATAAVTGTAPNQTLNYLTITNMGSGYIAAPTVTISGTATATALVNLVNVSGATTYYLGGNGGNGTYTAGSLSNASGGGGSSAGISSNGNAASGTSGGSAVAGGGAGANGISTTATAGTAATQVGGGGSGAVGASKLGGAGATGKIVISYPVISNSSSLTSFSATEGSPSDAQTFSVSGTNMNEGILVTAPSGFEVSSDASTYSGTVTIGAAGTISSTTVYIRLSASATIGSYNGLSITLSSSGAANASISIPNSSVTTGSTAAVLVNTSSLSAFPSTAVGSSSSESSFIVSGTYLGTDNITISAPSNFEVSLTSGSGFASSVSLTPVSGTVSNTTIYARFTPSGSGSNSGNIVVTQASVSDQNIIVSGSISTYYYQSGSLSSTSSWTAVSNGTGSNPTDFTTAGVTYKILNNATTDAGWIVSGSGSKIVVGDASSAAVTLTISSAGAITGTIDIVAASSGSNSLILQNSTLPSFGSLHSSSEVHCRASFSITSAPTDGQGFGNLYIDGGSSFTVTNAIAGNTIIQNSLIVETGSKFSTSSTSSNYITFNSGATATINGTIFVSKQKGLIVTGVTGTNGGALQFLGTESLSLGSSSTVEYNKATNASTYIISPRSDYANLTISGLDNNKIFTGATSLSGTFTINMTTSTSTSNLTGCGFLTLGNGATIVRTSGSLDAAPTFGSSVNLSYNGSTALVSGNEIPTDAGVLNNMTIANAAGVTLGSNATVNGTLTLTSGALSIASNSLTINGALAVTSGTISGTSESNLYLNGTDAGPVTLPLGAAASFNNISINNTNATPATYNASGTITVSGTLSLTSGTLALGAATLNINGAPIAFNGGSLTTTSSTNISIGGVDAGPFSLPANITNLAVLTINNTNATPATLNLNSAITCTSLALTSGTINDGGNVLTVGGNITGTGTHAGSGKIKIAGTSRTIAAVKIQNFEVGTGASVSSSAATFAGTFEMNGGNFTVGTGNTTTWLNGVTVFRNTTGQFNLSGGAYVFGTSSTDRVNLTINANVNTSGELPSSPAPGKIGTLTINSGYTYTSASVASRSASSMVLNGTFADGGCTFTVNGNISGSGTHTGSGKIVMSGNSTTSTISAVTLNNVDFNDADGFALNGTLNVNGNLNLVLGTVSTGTNMLKANSTVARTNGWVNGNLQKAVSAAGTYNFEVGTSAYSPASINVSAVATSGNMVVKANTDLSSQPAYASLELNTASALNRYWTISAVDGLAATYTGTYTFVSPGDLIGAPTVSTLKSALNTTGTNWTYTGTVTASTSTTVTSASTSSFGDMAFASPIDITVTADDKSKNENDADPALTYSVSGTLASGASFIGSLTRDAGESVGVYTIRQGTLAITPNPDNYNFTFNNGNLTILGLANPITNLASTHKSNNIVRLTWTSPVGVYDNILIFARPSNVTYTPSGPGSAYSDANSNIASAGVYGTDNYLVYAGNGNSIEVSGLTDVTDYNFSAFTYTGSSYSPVASVNVTTALSATSSFAAAYGNAQSVLTWINPDYYATRNNYWDEVMIVAKSGSDVDQSPSGDGSSYTANSIMGTGSDLGSGNYVVYKGSGSNVTVTNLTNGTAQHFKTFVRHGSVWSTAQSASITPNPYAVGDFGSLGSGMWTTNSSNWRKWDGNGWNTIPTAAPTAADNVFILSGHTVRTDASIRYCKNLTVEGTLKSDSLVNKPCYIRAYGTTITVMPSAFIGTTATGNDADGISLDLYSSNITLSGGGTVNFSRIRHSDTSSLSTLIVDNDVTLHYHGSTNGGNAGAIFTNSPMPITATHTLTINSGKTLTFGQYACYTPLSGANNNALSNKVFNINGSMTFLDGQIPGNTTPPVSGFVGNKNGYFSLGTSSGFTTTVNIGSTGTLTVSEFYPNGTQSGDVAGLGEVIAINVASGGQLNVSKIADFRNASQTVAGAGSFSLSSGCVMRIGSADGITASSAAGPIRTASRTYNSGHYKYEGTIAQSTGDALPSSISALTLNNAAGLSLTNSTTVVDSLSLSAGVVTTNSNTLTSNGITNRTSGWVAGNLKKLIALTTTTKSFEIGGANYYRPVTLTLNGVSNAGNITASVTQTDGAHPNINTSNISRTNRLNRYWTLANDGVALNSYDATFTFDSSDILNSAITSNFIIGKYSSSSWSYPTIGSASSTSTSIIAVNGFGDFQIGENCTTSSTEAITACDTYVWNGNTYTSSGIYTWTGTNASGCDSVATLNLTINNATTSTTNVTICASNAPYIWNGNNYSVSGTYSFTTTNANDCDSIATLNLTVSAFLANPVASVTQPTCATATGTITVTTPVGDGITYSIGGSYQSSPVFSGLSAGTYTISVQSGAGCTSAANGSATVNAQPQVPGAVSVSGLTNVCAIIGTSTTTTYTASAAGATGYTWTVPANTVLVSGQGTATITVRFLSGFASQPNKQIRVTATSSCGSSAQKIYYLSALLPGTPAAIVASTANVCPSIGTGVAITYRIPKVMGAASYIWTAQNGSTNITNVNGAGENDTLIAVTFENNFSSSNITVQAVNDCGVSGIRSLTVYRNNPSTPGLISGPANACAYIGETGVNATYSVAPNATVVTYTWTIPAGATNVSGQGTNSISFRYPQGFAGGSISVTATNGCGTSGSRSLTISVLPPSYPSQIDVINLSACPNRSYSYSVSSMPSNATSLHWEAPVGGTIVSGQGTTSIVVNYGSGLVNGNVSVIAVSNCGASLARNSNVKLTACAPGFAGNSNNKSIALTGGEEMLQTAVFPNPSASSFNLQLKGNSQDAVSIRVLDAQGRVVKQFRETTIGTINFGNELKAGVYMVEVKQGNAVMTKRLVKY